MDKFQLPTGTSAITVARVAQANPFLSAGYQDNPFPAAGVESDVLYTQHMPREIERINEWLGAIQEASTRPGTPVAPLAIEGALGVGKTHLLRYLERQLETRRVGQVLRKALTEHGMTRLVLSNLLVGGLPQPITDGAKVSSAPIPLVESLAEKLRHDREHANTINTVLRDSPIAPGLNALALPSDDQVLSEGHAWFARWLLRSPTTTSQRARLGLKGTLDAEGEAIRAIADVVRLAKHYGLVSTWFVMLDQLEELWRPGVITFGRRARFLTDLRLLIDQGLESAPMAVLVAWNTRVPSVAFSTNDLREHLRTEYGALWRRLGEPVAIPGLEERHVVPFAEEYLREADKKERDNEAIRTAFKTRLLAYGQKKIVAALRANSDASLGQGRYAASFVLQQWRDLATAVVAEQQE